MATKKTATPKKVTANKTAQPAKKTTPKKAAAPQKTPSNKKVASKPAAPKKTAPKKPASPPKSTSIKPSTDALARRKVSAEQRHQMIATMAYQRWVDRGCVHGFAEQDWLDCERLVDRTIEGK